MTCATFPTIRHECRYPISASHDLRGVTAHPDAMLGVHAHEWLVTCIFTQPYNPFLGFQRDEVIFDSSWGGRIRELSGKNLSELMKLPATAENFACWLLFFWLPRLSDQEVNFELSGVCVSKGNHSTEVMRTEQNKRAWMSFGGETA